MSDQEKTDYETRLKLITDYCLSEMARHDELGRSNWRWYARLQISSIIFGLLVPVAIASGYDKILPSLLGAFAAIAATCNSTFRFWERSVGPARVATSLNHEHMSFNAQIGEAYGPQLGREQRLISFHTRVTKIVMRETERLQNQPQQPSQPGVILPTPTPPPTPPTSYSSMRP